MLDRISTYLLYGNRYCGLEHTSIDGNDSIVVSIVKQSKKELNQELSYECVSINKVSEKITKNQHAHLIVNNEKVLSKTVQSSEKNPQRLAYKSFPNIKLDDFYLEVLSENDIHFVTICRKDYVDGLIKEYLQNNIYIINVSLGNNIISTVKSFINEGQVFTSNALIKIEKDNIILIDKTETEKKFYDINGLRVLNTELLSLSAAIQSVLKNNSTYTNLELKHDALTNDFKQTRFFNQFLKFSGMFILGLLLINFIFFNQYFNKVNDLQEITSINELAKQRILDLNKAVSNKQKLADDLLKSNGSKSSFYANSIIDGLSESILLSEYNYQPLLKRIKPDKPILLDSQIIMVSGTSSDSELFSSWIAELEKIDWVKKVDINSYGIDKNGFDDFQIKISLGVD